MKSHWRLSNTGYFNVFSFYPLPNPPVFIRHAVAGGKALSARALFRQSKVAGCIAEQETRAWSKN
ncbi:hypothetical protein EJP617_34100 [Erwinia sp. Ejp617]|nr:hypothetical protein EJP617_34100 [Erwinia sp. Ejp617]